LSRPPCPGDAGREVAYCLTSIAPEQPTPANSADCSASTGGAIESRVHWSRDRAWCEDHSTLRAGTAPVTMAIIRNTLTAAFRLAGWTNIRRALRHFSHNIDRCTDLITKPIKTVKNQT
jgi:hypothetical protein